MRHGNISELDSALDTGFALVKTICDDADAWGEKKLGHHYVRISNKTIEIRCALMMPADCQYVMHGGIAHGVTHLSSCLLTTEGFGRDGKD